jgi:hypothetical protein
LSPPFVPSFVPLPFVPSLCPLRNALSRPIVSLQFEYFFEPTDLTEGGKNDTIFLDFLSLESELPPSELRVLIGIHFYSLRPVAQSDEMFTVALPFAGFVPRGGGTSLPDFTQATGIEFSLRVSEFAGGGPNPLNSRMHLDRIRVGRVVPEPCLAILFVTTVAFTVSQRRQRF